MTAGIPVWFSIMVIVLWLIAMGLVLAWTAGITSIGPLKRPAGLGVAAVVLSLLTVGLTLWASFHYA